MLLEMIITSLAVFVIMAVWVLFQQFIRRHTPGQSNNPDPLSSQFGCSSCELSGSCGLSKTSSEKPPVEVRLFD